ncbi:nuclear mitotic apparatus protein 1 isoform X2 [Falco rusticolus]|uniref:nuclear mitotic apparatus protein 1 isoform X2 n=1 Tax=Falco rusticolus TaxID=120794 RepID=UPI00188651D1|nr:nuclear mitotic apparatus protein 1 isoform X2 [Falco rusticolus]
MPLHEARAAALLAWVNSTKACTHPLDDLSQLQDCSVFIRIINKIHRSKEGESVLEQPLPERISFICGFLEKYCKHKLAAENLVLSQKLLEGEELALAKVTVLLLYYTSMSCKSPEDWKEFDYETQVELASILKFVLDSEESLDESLEIFLQRKAPLSASSSSSEEHSLLFSFPHKQELRFLELKNIVSSSDSPLPSTPFLPVGGVMQTPQFQLQRLKKQLAFERQNRDELEVELAENLKLIMEKEAQITVMQQRIDHLVLLNKRQAADQLEPKEMEELRERNESLTVRLHNTLKQCQDLKTEKGQMERKIDQLSEENGDLSFKLREIASRMVRVQEALNELSEEHNVTLAQSREKQGQLEDELCASLQEKKYLEEKIEILQGKISVLEDQLAKLEDCSTQEKGEVMGDILKLEELKQEVSSLVTKGAELQATILRLEEEKQQLSGLVASLQSSLSESHQARERLVQDLQAWEASEPSRQQEQEVEVKKLSRELTLLSTRLEESLREMARREEEAECLHQEVERAKVDCAAERACKAELEEQLQNSLNEQRVHQEELARCWELMKEKDGELDELRQKNISQDEELRDLQKTVSKLKGELSLEMAKERVPKGDKLQGFSEATQSRDVEGDNIKATCSKEMSLKSLEEKTHDREQEAGLSQDLYQGKLKESHVLSLQVEELAQQEAMATLEQVEAKAEMAEALREAAQQKEKALELQKELQKGRELTQSKTAVTAAEKELASLSSAVQEKGWSEESWKEELEKQRLTIKALKRDRFQREREDKLRQEVKVCQDQCLQKEQQLAALQREFNSAQVERASLESQHCQELEQRAKTLAALQAELAKARLEATEVPSLRERLAEQDWANRQLQVEAAEQAARLAGLQQAEETWSRGQQWLEAELGRFMEQHTQNMKRLQELAASSQQEAEEVLRKLEIRTNEYETSKAVALEEKRRMTAQVEELNEKLTQHEKAVQAQEQRVKVLEGELRAEATRQQEKVAELQAQLTQKEQAAKHYKEQMEKAKMCYDAEKQQNQDLAEKLKAMEQLQKENAELRMESERLAKELEQSILQVRESELSCQNLTSQVCSLEAQVGTAQQDSTPFLLLPFVAGSLRIHPFLPIQVELANQQLQELGKFQGAADTLKGQETFCQNPADLSTDSLDLGVGEAQPLNATRKAGCPQLEASVPPGNEESLASKQLPRKAESLESLHFAPRHSHRQLHLGTSAHSLGDLSLHSGDKTPPTLKVSGGSPGCGAGQGSPAERDMAKTEQLDSADISCTTSAAQPPNAAPGTSTGSLTSIPSREALIKQETSSPQEPPSNPALLGLPGYRPVTRSSARQLQSRDSSSLDQSNIYLGTCQDEPEQLDWQRIAELQQRNQACPPHLKSCYPLERTSSGTITDEQVKTGDPEETLRRFSMQPPQRATWHSTLAGSWQQRKHLLDESYQETDTPQSKKWSSCFLLPQPRRECSEPCSSEGPSKQPGPSGQAEKHQPPQDFSKPCSLPGPSGQARKHQSLGFSILNTPKRLGTSLLRRAAWQQTSSKRSGSSTRRSPRIAAAKAPKDKASHQEKKS